MLNFMLTPLCCTLRSSNTSLPYCQVLWPKMGTMAWIAKQSQKSYNCTKKFHTPALLHSLEASQYRMAYFMSLYSFTYTKTGQLHGKWLHRTVPDLYLLPQMSWICLRNLYLVLVKTAPSDCAKTNNMDNWNVQELSLILSCPF